MKAIRTYNNLTIEVEGKTQVDLFRNLAMCDEVFGGHECIAKVDGEWLRSEQIKFSVRSDREDNEYFELVCTGGEGKNKNLRYFKKRFGQHKSGGTLFPKTQIPDGEEPGINGWSRYVKKEGSYSQPKPEPKPEPAPASYSDDDDIPF